MTVLTQVQEVIEDQEVYLDGYRLPIKGQVRPALLGQMPEKVVFGDVTRADQRIAAEWVLADNRGGLGVDYADPKTQGDRFWWASVDTRRNRSMILHPKVYTVKFHRLVDVDTYEDQDIEPIKFFEHQDFWHVIAKTSDDALHVLQWDADNGYFISPAGIGKTLTNVTDVTDVLSTGDKVFVAAYNATDHAAQPYCWYEYDEATDAWTDHAQDADGDGAMFFLLFGDQVLKLDQAGKLKLWDGLTWFKKLQVTIPRSNFTGLVSFFDAQDNPTPYLATTRGLYSISLDYNKIYPTAIQLAPSPINGQAVAVWNDGYLYYTEGLAVHRFTPKQVQSIGPNRDDGLPRDYRGYISGMIPTPDYLVGFIDNQSLQNPASGVLWFSEAVDVDTTAANAVAAYEACPWFYDKLGWNAMILWNSAGWHTLHIPPTANTPLKVGAYTTLSGNKPRVWFGLSKQCWYLQLPDGTTDPTKDLELEYNVGSGDSPDGEFLSSWFDGNMAEVWKVGLSLKLVVESNIPNAGLGNTKVRVSYAVDRHNAFTELGWCTAATDPGDGEFTFYMPNSGTNTGKGIKFKSIRLKIELYGDPANLTQTPIVVFGALRFQRVLDNLLSWSFRVNADRDYKGHTASEIVGKLEDLADQKELVEFAWRARSGETRRRLVRLVQFGGLTSTGRQPRGQYDVTVSEVVA
jgi:hypothetical protein